MIWCSLFGSPQRIGTFDDLHQQSRRRRIISKHFNKLTPAEAERLALLANEMGDVIQIVGKVLLHGSEDSTDGGPTNREFLQKELGDVKHAIELMCNMNDIDRDDVYKRSEGYALLVEALLHHQGAAS